MAKDVSVREVGQTSGNDRSGSVSLFTEGVSPVGARPGSFIVQNKSSKLEKKASVIAKAGG